MATVRFTGKDRVFQTTQSSSVTVIPKEGGSSGQAQRAGRHPECAHFIHGGIEQGSTWESSASTYSPAGMLGNTFYQKSANRVSTHTDARRRNTRSLDGPSEMENSQVQIWGRQPGRTRLQEGLLPHGGRPRGAPARAPGHRAACGAVLLWAAGPQGPLPAAQSRE